MNEYLLESSQVLKAYESALNFGDVLGGIQTSAPAMEGMSVKDRLATVGKFIKEFFQKIADAIARFFKENITGETMIEMSAVTEIKVTIREFMDVFNQGVNRSLNVTEVNDAILEVGGKLEEVIKSHTADSEKILENIAELKKNSKLGKSEGSKINATPVKECKQIIEAAYNVLKASTNKVYELSSRKLSDPVTGDDALRTYERYIKVLMIHINKLYELLMKLLNGGKVHYSAHAKADQQAE
jgi:hypothetical protein